MLNIYLHTFVGDVLATVLALYMYDKHQPLPSHEEVLICTRETTAEEVSVSQVVICVYHLHFHSVECPPLNSKYRYKRFSKSKGDDYNAILGKNSAKIYGPF